jgi:hypothetical protein
MPGPGRADRVVISATCVTPSAPPCAKVQSTPTFGWLDASSRPAAVSLSKNC